MNENSWATPCPKYDCRKTACKCGLEYVNIPTSLGDDSEGSNVAPKNGAYCNALVIYEANNHVYIYSKEGVPTLIDVDASDISTLEQEVRKAQKDVYELREDIDDFIYGFDTVAQMKAATNLSNGDRVRTLGYYAKNDDGGALYKVTDTQPSGHYETLNGLLYAELITNGFIRPEQLGAYGDGTHDDSSTLQKALDSEIPVILSPKTYLCFSLTVTHKTQLKGNGAILKRPQLNVPPYNKTVAQMKWIRTLSITEDCSIDGITFDNNCFTMWQPSDGYAQEQSASVIVYNSSKKINFGISNCHFRNSAGDGLHIVQNVNASVNNCSSIDCFRGGFVSTGYGSEINLNGWDSKSMTSGVSDGFDIEVDSSSTIDQNKYILNISNVILDYDLDIGCPNNGAINIDNLVMREFDNTLHPGFYFTLGSATINVSNSILRRGDVANNSVFFTSDNGKISFNRCSIFGSDLPGSPILQPTQFAGATYRDLKLVLDNCYISGYQIIAIADLHGDIIFSNNIIECTIFNAGRPPATVTPKNLVLKGNDITFLGTDDMTVFVFGANQFSLDGKSNYYLYSNLLHGNPNSVMHLSGYPSIYFDGAPIEAGYIFSLGTGAAPIFYGQNRLIIVPTASDLNFRGFVQNEDVAIAADTNLKYRYTSGTTWTQIT